MYIVGRAFLQPPVQTSTPIPHIAYLASFYNFIEPPPSSPPCYSLSLTLSLSLSLSLYIYIYLYIYIKYIYIYIYIYIYKYM